MKQIAPELHVGSQLQETDLPDLAQRGIRTIISLRPDEEEGIPLPATAAARLAAAHGLAFQHLPVAMANATDEDIVDHFENMLEQADGPVFAYCKSGTRVAIAWALSAARRQPVDCVLAATQRAGFDLSMLVDEMQEQADRYAHSKTVDAKFDCLPVPPEPTPMLVPA